MGVEGVSTPGRFLVARFTLRTRRRQMVSASARTSHPAAPKRSGDACLGISRNGAGRRTEVENAWLRMLCWLRTPVSDAQIEYWFALLRALRSWIFHTEKLGRAALRLGQRFPVLREFESQQTTDLDSAGAWRASVLFGAVCGFAMDKLFELKGRGLEAWPALRTLNTWSLREYWFPMLV